MSMPCRPKPYRCCSTCARKPMHVPPPRLRCPHHQSHPHQRSLCMTEEAIPTSPSPEATSPPLPAPTYSAEPMGERTVYTCLIPDAGHEDGICGHKTTDEGFMTQHMAQRHSGIMIKTTL